MYKIININKQNIQNCSEYVWKYYIYIIKSLFLLLLRGKIELIFPKKSKYELIFPPPWVTEFLFFMHPGHITLGWVAEPLIFCIKHFFVYFNILSSNPSLAEHSSFPDSNSSVQRFPQTHSQSSSLISYTKMIYLFLNWWWAKGKFSIFLAFFLFSSL